MTKRWNIRPARADDLPLIMQSWLRGFAVASGRGPSATYYEAQRIVIASCIEHGRTVIAEPPDAGDDAPIMGWACGEGEALHFCYVKRVYRRAGMARQLAREACSAPVATATHVARPWQARLCAEHGIRRSERWVIYRALNEATELMSRSASRSSC